MKLKEFFNSELVSLPRGGFDDGNESFDQFLGTLFDRYYQQLQSVDDLEFPEIKSAIPTLLTTSQALAASLLKALRTSLDGRAHLAYQEISTALSKINRSPFRSELSGSSNSINLSDPF